MVRRHGAEFHGTRVAQLAYLSQTEFAKLSGPRYPKGHRLSLGGTRTKHCRAWNQMPWR